MGFDVAEPLAHSPVLDFYIHGSWHSWLQYISLVIDVDRCDRKLRSISIPEFVAPDRPLMLIFWGMSAESINCGGILFSRSMSWPSLTDTGPIIMVGSIDPSRHLPNRPIVPINVSFVDKTILRSV